MTRFGYFTPASSSDFAAKFVGGRLKASGKGLSFVCTPWTSIAVVSTAQQGIAFMFKEQTKDGQTLVVQGSLQASFIPARLMERYDFAVNIKTGGYLKPNSLELLRAEVQNVLQSAVREKVGDRGLEEHMQDRTALAAAVIAAAKAKTGEFKNLGVEVMDAFVTGIEPANKDLEKALEAKKREELLAQADKALADRRMDAALNTRKLREYEASTELSLEQKRTELIEAHSQNLIAEAAAEAEATGKKLDPYKQLDPGLVMALAMQEFARSGHIENFSVTPDFLTAIRSAARTEKG